MFGDAVLVSHAIVGQWDKANLVSLSRAGIYRLRNRLPDTWSSPTQASLQSLQAGTDLLCIGNSLLNEKAQMGNIADYVAGSPCHGTPAGPAGRKSSEWIGRRKTQLN